MLAVSACADLQDEMSDVFATTDPKERGEGAADGGIRQKPK
jgi:hypothetical protein